MIQHCIVLGVSVTLSYLYVWIIVGLLCCGSVSCKNSDNVLVQWWHYPPYAISHDSAIPGLHPCITPSSGVDFNGVFHRVVHKLLSTCHPDMKNNKKITFQSKRVRNQIEFHEHLASPLPETITTAIYLPVSVRSSSDAILRTLNLRDEDYQFLTLVESPGSVLFYLNHDEAVGSDLLNVILQSWPMLIFILLGAGYSGIIMWLLVSITITYITQFTTFKMFLS